MHEAKGMKQKRINLFLKCADRRQVNPYPACTCTRLFREAGFGEVEMKVFPASEKLYVGTRSIV